MFLIAIGQFDEGPIAGKLLYCPYWGTADVVPYDWEVIYSSATDSHEGIHALAERVCPGRSYYPPGP